MPRKNRLFVPGLPHLIELRGHNYEQLFRAPDDYHSFLERLDKAMSLYQVRLYAYTLTPEHILLFLEVADKALMGRFIQYIGRSYVPWYNNRYHRRGALWESRYWSSPVEPEAYFLLVKQYTEHACHADEGFHSFADMPPSRISDHPCWLCLGPTAESRRRQYRQFCQRALSPALRDRISTALKQNCLLATPGYSQRLEVTLARSLSPHLPGRPRKHYDNPVAAWTWLEKQAGRLLQHYCYREIRMPLLERWERELLPALFSDGYREEPLNHQALLSGDGTRGCLRAIAQNQDLQQTSKLWYQGTLFRRDQRESETLKPVYQLGVEAFGYPGIDIELEFLSLQARFFQLLNIASHVELRLNVLGTPETLSAFRDALHAYYQPLSHLLSPADRRHLAHCPEKLLLSHEPLLKYLADSAPKYTSFISAQAQQRFAALCDGLTQMGLPFTHDPTLFPANDYCHLVFEWHSPALTSSTLLCRGGRYDSSASLLLGRPLYACGFAFMMEPILQLLHASKQLQSLTREIDVAVIPTHQRVHHRAFLLSQSLRQRYPSLSITSDFSGLKSSVSQKNAQRQGARFIILIDDDESEITLIDQRSQHLRRMTQDRLSEVLSASLNGA
ncbi:ATP phosphoribosyltransferase regulatory subunit [Pantoea sp. C2G6]|uniref:ATP phosphoribosyltransferase regulatory subunit n=1 Tax=Pantoea sp. C2G6 TaxID=3243084 RepID=UPI003EDB0E76